MPFGDWFVDEILAIESCCHTPLNHLSFFSVGFGSAYYLLGGLCIIFAPFTMCLWNPKPLSKKDEDETKVGERAEYKTF